MDRPVNRLYVVICVTTIASALHVRELAIYYAAPIYYAATLQHPSSITTNLPDLYLL